MADLSTQYLGLNLRNPLIAGSSGWTDNLRNLLMLEQNGCGAVVLKSLFEEEIVREIQSNLKSMGSDSFIYPETIDFYEKNDFPKQKTDEYLELIRQSKSQLSIPVIASINCISPGQWTYFPKKIEEAGADAIEINIFILPSDPSQTGNDNEKTYIDILQNIRKSVSIPVSLKLSNHFSGLTNFLVQLNQSGADGLVLFNRFFQPDIDIEKLEVVASHILSHPSEMQQTLRWISLLSGRVSCDISASTGIHNGQSLIKMLLVGAKTVQIASSLYMHGTDCIHEILGSLTTWMDRKGFATLDEFRGLLSHSNLSNPAIYERTQFMKYFRGYN